MSEDLVRVLARNKTQAELNEESLRLAQEQLDGVRVTNLSAEGINGSGVALSGDPGYLLNLVERALEARKDIDAGGTGSKQMKTPPMGHAVNFSTRQART